MFSFANVNKRASAGGEILSVALRQIEEGGGGWFVGARQRLECMPSLTYDVNEEGGGELLSAYVRRSSMEGRIRVERVGCPGWQRWQRRKWLLFSSGRSDVWDRGRRAGKGVEEKRDCGTGHHQHQPYHLATVSAKSTLHHFPRAKKKDE